MKEAHRLHAEGLSFETIAREWDAEGLPTLSQKGRWHGKTIQRLVQRVVLQTFIAGERFAQLG